MFAWTPPAEGAALLARAAEAARAEASAAAARLDAVGAFVDACTSAAGGATEEWAVDVLAAAAAEVAAALRISQGLAESQVRYAEALRHRLPELGARFAAGDVSEAAFRAAVFRTGLIEDAEMLARVDATLARRMPTWGSAGRREIDKRIDRVVARVDRDAVRRRKDFVGGRGVTISPLVDGLSEVHATVYATDAEAIAQRIAALERSVCDADPRTAAERRADALAVAALGGDRLSCRCDLDGCPAGGRVVGPVVVHVVTDQATLDGSADGGAVVPGYDGLFPADLVAEIAAEAKRRPLLTPTSEPEPRYRPSSRLAEWVRWRDLTCRFPNCDVPAHGCDLDHTVPYGDGGSTRASNLKCLCRFHHLVKTFWGWGDEQFDDGTVLWTAPTGVRYVTVPGGVALFGGLAAPGTATPAPSPEGPCTDRTAMMPHRRRSRRQQRAADVLAERTANHRARMERLRRYAGGGTRDGRPPPF